MKFLFATLFILLSFTLAELPELNKKVIEYVNKNMQKKVGRGECWDLAAGALAYSNAYFDRSSKKTVTIYGRELNPKNDEILPGDMIQFKNVRMKWREGNTYHQSSMIQHTAIVYEVNGPGDYEITHQNTGAWGKKVGVSNLKLSRMTSGRIWVYRPVASKADM